MDGLGLRARAREGAIDRATDFVQGAEVAEAGQVDRHPLSAGG